MTDEGWIGIPSTATQICCRKMLAVAQKKASLGPDEEVEI
jgi:hypothetical protein